MLWEYAENTEKIPPKYQKDARLSILGGALFGGPLLGVPEFRASGAFFRYFSYKFRVWRHLRSL